MEGHEVKLGSWRPTAGSSRVTGTAGGLGLNQLRRPKRPEGRGNVEANWRNARPARGD